MNDENKKKCDYEPYIKVKCTHCDKINEVYPSKSAECIHCKKIFNIGESILNEFSFLID